MDPDGDSGRPMADWEIEAHNNKTIRAFMRGG